MAVSATRLVLAIATALLAGCGAMPPAGPYSWVPSPNFNERRPNFVIIHQTDSSTQDEALATLTSPYRAVSTHYLIGKDGCVTQLVEEGARAWHAGESYWGGLTDLNSASIGIELVNRGDTPFTPEQIDALLELLRELKERYRIPTANFLAHSDVAPRRKVDPNRLFPWPLLAEKGFGLWCGANEIAALDERVAPLLGLRALGYEVVDAGKTALAFRRHFRRDDASAELNDEDIGVLSCLLRKKAAME